MGDAPPGTRSWPSPAGSAPSPAFRGCRQRSVLREPGMSYDGRGVIVSEQAHPACLGRGMGGAGNKAFPPIVYLWLGSAGARPRDGQDEGALMRSLLLATVALAPLAASP